MYSSQVVYIYIGLARPFKLRATNTQNLLNEFTIVTLTSLSVFFTDFCPQPNAQYNISWIYLFVVLVYIVLSFSWLLKSMFRSVWRYALKYYRIGYSKMKKHFCKKQ